MISNAGFPLISWLQEQDGHSLVVSWQTLAAMATVSSVIVVAAMAYLRAYFGGELVKNKFETLERIGKEIKDNIQPLERRVENVEGEVRAARRMRDQDDPHH